MSEEATKTFDAEITTLGDTLADLSLKAAVDLADYMKETYGIEPAAGGAVMVAAAGGGEDEDDVEQTEFDIVIEAVGDKKIQVIKAVREITGLGLKDAKVLVDGAPATVKEKVSKEEADKIQITLEEAGASVGIK